MLWHPGSVSSDKVDAHELKNYEEINENLAMIRSFQVLFRVKKLEWFRHISTVLVRLIEMGVALSCCNGTKKSSKKVELFFMQIYEQCLMQLDCYRK
jgi:hypothetical protein